MKILGISGSVRRDSHNTTLLRAAADLLPSGVELVVFDGLEAVPPYNEDRDTDDPPAAVAELREAIAEADAVVFSTPEYNASIPGVLKNAVDWASRPFPDHSLRGKPALVMGASSGLFGAVWAQAELRKVLDHIGVRVIDEELPVGSAAEAFEGGGGLADPGTEARLRDQLAQFVAEAEGAAAAVAA